MVRLTKRLNDHVPNVNICIIIFPIGNRLIFQHTSRVQRLRATMETPLLARRARRRELSDVRLSVVTETRRASACFIEEKRLNAAAEVSEPWVTFWGLPITDFNRKTQGRWQNGKPMLFIANATTMHSIAW